MEEYEKTKVHFFKGLLIGGALAHWQAFSSHRNQEKDMRSDIKKKGNKIVKDGKEIYADASYKSKRDFWGSQASGEGVLKRMRKKRRSSRMIRQALRTVSRRIYAAVPTPTDWRSSELSAIPSFLRLSPDA